MIVYLAGSISGMSYEEVTERLGAYASRLELAGYDVLSPMTGKGHLRTEIEFRSHGYDHPLSNNHAIVERDRWMVSKSDVVFADLYEGDRVSIGTVMELAWAHHLGIHTVVAMPPGDNVHRHAFILEAADVIFDDAAQALDYLEELGA